MPEMTPKHLLTSVEANVCAYARLLENRACAASDKFFTFDASGACYILAFASHTVIGAKEENLSPTRIIRAAAFDDLFSVLAQEPLRVGASQDKANFVGTRATVPAERRSGNNRALHLRFCGGISRTC